MVVQRVAGERHELCAASADGVVPLETTQANTAVGFFGYCGTFEIRDGGVVHHIQVGILTQMSGQSSRRSVIRDGHRLILGTPPSAQLEGQRVH
jgi:Lipocalin-like domain